VPSMRLFAVRFGSMTRVNLVSRIAVSLVVGMLATIGISWSLVILMPRGSDTWSIEPDSEGNDGPLAWPVPVPVTGPGANPFKSSTPRGGRSSNA
jgi:hypothetical protein